MKFIRILFIIPLLLIAVHSHATPDPCSHFKQVQAQSPYPINAKCIPLTAMLTWKIKESLTRHFGGFTPDIFKYKLCESYPAALVVSYQGGSGKFNSVNLYGPWPQEEQFVKTDIISAEAGVLGCYPGGEQCTPYQTASTDAFRVKIEPALRGISFGHNDLEKPKGQIESNEIELLDDKIMPKDKGIRSGLPDAAVVRAKGKNAFGYADAKYLMAKGRYSKMFKVYDKIEYQTKETYEIDGDLQLVLAIGGVIDKTHSQRVSYDYPDPKCPYYSSKVCYDVKIDPCKSEVVVTVPIHLRSVPGIPMKHVETIEDPKGDIQIYMPTAPFTLQQVSQTDIEKVKHDAGVIIEGAWNYKKRLKGKGDDIAMTFKVKWVEPHENPCHVVDVLPGEGRSSTSEWYINDWDLMYTAHEYGHYIGLDDEYKDRMCPKRPAAKDDNIMANGTTPMTRHYKPIAGWVGKSTGTNYKIKGYPGATP